MFIITDGLQVCGKTRKNERNSFVKCICSPSKNFSLHDVCLRHVCIWQILITCKWKCAPRTVPSQFITVSVLWQSHYITGLITQNHHSRTENWIFKITLQPQALWIKADLQTLRISLPHINLTSSSWLCLTQMVSLLEVNNNDVITDDKQSNTIHTLSGGPVTEPSSANTARPHLPPQKTLFSNQKIWENLGVLRFSQQCNWGFWPCEMWHCH